MAPDSYIKLANPGSYPWRHLRIGDEIIYNCRPWSLKRLGRSLGTPAGIEDRVRDTSAS
jgi:hypothetical protein